MLMAKTAVDGVYYSYPIIIPDETKFRSFPIWMS